MKKSLKTMVLETAYLAVGYWKDKRDIYFESKIDEEKRKELLEGWERAMRCALAWGDDDE